MGQLPGLTDQREDPGTQPGSSVWVAGLKSSSFCCFSGLWAGSWAGNGAAGTWTAVPACCAGILALARLSYHSVCPCALFRSREFCFRVHNIVLIFVKQHLNPFFNVLYAVLIPSCLYLPSCVLEASFYTPWFNNSQRIDPLILVWDSSNPMHHGEYKGIFKFPGMWSFSCLWQIWCLLTSLLWVPPKILN